MTGVGTVWHKFCSVGGITTELLGINAISGCPRLQVVVFPGNPGSAVFFRTFMLAVHRQLRGQADVLAVTHAGHDPDTNHGGRLWDLSLQVAHKVAFLREHVLRPGRPPVLLVGHSIGAAMMIKAVAEIEGLSCSGGQGRQHLQREEAVVHGNPLAEERSDAAPLAVVNLWQADGSEGRDAGRQLPAVVKLVAVFPFFETNFGGNWRQRLLRSLAAWYEAMGWLGSVISWLPWGLRLALVKLNAAMDADAAALTARLVARHPVRNAFFLASHEFKDLSKPWDWGLMRALGRRLHVMGCARDTWLSRQQYEEMRARVPGLQATWHPDLRHAFCVSERQSDAVSETVAAVAASIPGLELDLDMGVGADAETGLGLAADPGLDLELKPAARNSRAASAVSVSRADSSETISSAFDGASESLAVCKAISSDA